MSIEETSERETDDSVASWYLVAQVPVVRAGSDHQLIVHREVPDAEVLTIRQANRLITTLTNQMPYWRVAELYERLMAAYASLGGDRPEPARRVTAEMNRVISALKRAVVRLPVDLEQQASRLDATEDEIEALEAAIAEETVHPAFRLLQALGADEGDLFAADEDALIADADTLARISAGLPPLPPDAGLMLEIIEGGVVSCQRLMGRELLIYEDRVADADRSLRQFAVEVPEGGPGLMRTNRPLGEHPDMGSTGFEALPLLNVELPQRLLIDRRASNDNGY